VVRARRRRQWARMTELGKRLPLKVIEADQRATA
jgi:hypothetical protein